MTRTFARWSRRSLRHEDSLCDAIDEVAAGLVDTNLGGHVFKKRIPLPGRGKRGGARALIGTDLRNRWFLVFGFTKNDSATISARELDAVQRIVAVMLALEDESIERLLATGELTEICREEESNPGRDA